MNSGSILQILVYIRNIRNEFKQASFIHCLFEQLENGNGLEKSRCQVACYLQNNMLILEHGDTSKRSKNGVYRITRPLYTLCHPPFCPVLNISEIDRESLPDDVLSRGVNVGVAIILESSDNCVLLTKRASHMRTFPSVWVPPGGHIEIDESLERAGLRELLEETGLKINNDPGCSKILGLWESVYPPTLGLGMPHRHHVVVYIHFASKKTSNDLEKDLKLDPKEVDASIWLPERIIKSVVDGSEFDKEEQLKFTTVSQEGEHNTGILDTSVLLEKMPPPVGQGERISTGTRYALELWLTEKNKCRPLPATKSNL